MNEQFPSWLLALIPALPLFGAFVNLFGAKIWDRRFVHTVAVGSVVAAFIVTVFCIVKGVFPGWKAYHAALDGGIADGQFQGIGYKAWTWIRIGDLQLDMAFRMDTLTAVMCSVITFVGSLIHIYSTGYMAHEPRYAAYFGYLNLFTGAMLILVLGDSLPVMFIGWEGVGLCSYLLIGFWFENTDFANAGRKAFVVNRIGDFCFILGVCLLWYVTKTVDFPALKSPDAIGAMRENVGWLGGERIAALAGILLFLGACGKSAQIPLYVWLPDAMAGPTPVSALIHAATMVTAGVYMIARLSFLFASSATAMAVIAGVGCATALAAAYMAFAQTDLKKVLAYSTVSQLGFMFVAVGCGAWTAGVFHLVTHAFFKAGLFLGAGSVMHAMSGSGDIMKMGGLKKWLPSTRWTFAIYCFAIAGLPLLSGFFSKDEILAGAWGSHVSMDDPAGGWPFWYGKVLWAGLSVAALGTSFYMYRLYYLVFHGECRADEETKSHIHESPISMTGPLWALAIFTCFLGFLGLPHLQSLHLPNVFHEWLAPVLAPEWFVNGLSAAPSEAGHHMSDGTIIGLMVGATTLAAIGWAMAKAMYGKGPSSLAEKFASTDLGAKMYDLSKNKFYVDEIYELSILKPFRVTCQVLYKAFDKVVIDMFFVGGAAAFVDLMGGIVRWFQNGQVQRYLVMVVAGGAIVFVYASSSSVNFDYASAGDPDRLGKVVLRADVGAGAGAAEAKVEWDFDGDGEPDATTPEITWDFGGPGEYRVTLTIEDGVFSRESSITKKVVIEDPLAAAKREAEKQSQRVKGGAR